MLRHVSYGTSTRKQSVIPKLLCVCHSLTYDLTLRRTHQRNWLMWNFDINERIGIRILIVHCIQKPKRLNHVRWRECLQRFTRITDCGTARHIRTPEIEETVLSNLDPERVNFPKLYCRMRQCEKTSTNNNSTNFICAQYKPTTLKNILQSYSFVDGLSHSVMTHSFISASFLPMRHDLQEIR